MVERTSTCNLTNHVKIPDMATKILYHASAIFVFTLAILFAGCDKPLQECTISGSVFIVSKGGTSFKLGLVPVVIADPDAFQHHLKETFESLKTNADNDRSQYDKLKLAYTEAFQAILPYLHKFKATGDEVATSRLKLSKLARIYDSLHTVNKLYDANEHEYQLAASDFKDKLIANKQTAEKLNLQLEKVRYTYDKTLQFELSAAKFKDTVIDEIIFNPQVIASLRTDADGHFVTKLPRGKKVIVAARGQRLVGN